MNSSLRIRQIVCGVLSAALLWSYWPVLTAMAHRWWTDPKYTHGWIVPLFALGYLLYRWGRSVRQGQPGAKASAGIRENVADLGRLLWASGGGTGSAAEAALPRGAWYGVPVLLAGLALHSAGEFLFIDWLSEISLLPALAGLALCVGGFRWLWLAAPSIAFLVFMLPLPYAVEVGLANPLQRVGAVSSNYLLQLIGFSASAEGNKIVLNSGPIDVAEACSGLAMLDTFFALATAIAMVVRRSWWEKLLIFLSAAPIAVAANVIRITLTGILYETTTNEWARLIYHDGAGYLMMTIALLMLWGELWVLSHLLVEVPADEKEAATVAMDLGNGLGLGMAPAPNTAVRKMNVAGPVQRGPESTPRPRLDPAINTRVKPG